MGHLGVGKKIILKYILYKCGEGVDWICLAWDIQQWQALTNTVIKLWVPK
jgi:hypothetical protein